MERSRWYRGQYIKRLDSWELNKRGLKWTWVHPGMDHGRDAIIIWPRYNNLKLACADIDRRLAALGKSKKNRGGMGS